MRSAPSLPVIRRRRCSPPPEDRRRRDLISPSTSGASRWERPDHASIVDVEALDQHLELAADQRAGARSIVASAAAATARPAPRAIASGHAGRACRELRVPSSGE